MKKTKPKLEQVSCDCDVIHEEIVKRVRKAGIIILSVIHPMDSFIILNYREIYLFFYNRVLLFELFFRKLRFKKWLF